MGLLRETTNVSFLKRVKVGTKTLMSNMLQFTNDTLYIHNNIYNVLPIKSMLRCFELTSRLKVNFIKTKIRAIRLQYNTLKSLSTFKSCRIMVMLFHYLDIKIGDKSRRVSLWKKVVDKVKNMLAKCKDKHLSFARRFCLIKPIITYLPLFYMSSFKRKKM